MNFGSRWRADLGHFGQMARLINSPRRSCPGRETFGLARVALVGTLLLALAGGAGAQVFRVATFNVENYVLESSPQRAAKSAESRAKVVESIASLRPDIIGLEEIGSTNALLELQGALKRPGVDLPYWEEVNGYETNIHLAVLSRWPIVGRTAHTNETFLLNGRRCFVRRGFAEVEIEINSHYRLTVLAAHLKSRVPSAIEDEQEWRLQEALLLRKIIEARLAADPGRRLVVLGDFNDVKDSRTIRTIVGHGTRALFDTRPAERNETHSTTAGAWQSRPVTWTEYYAREDLYSRIDYILVSRALESDWLGQETYVLNLPDWGLASDHRPLVAGFMAR